MGSWFLNPWFLAGLTVLGVPVWIHLIRSRRDRPQPFPSLMFLERVPLHAAKRQRLRDIPLLLLRLAALLLLVLAFARPVGSRGDAAAGGRQARDVVLLLDTSWSMAYEGVWDEAQEAVGREIGSLQAGDRAALVFFDEGARQEGGWSTDPVQLRETAAAARPGSRGTDYAPAIALAEQLLDESGRPVREAVMISDFQQAGRAGEGRVLLPAGVGFRTVDVGVPEPWNTGVASVGLGRDGPPGEEEVTVTARLLRFGEPPSGPARLVLEGGGSRQVQEVPEGWSNGDRVRFDPVPMPREGLEARVSLEGDLLMLDDVFFFALPPREAVEVLLIRPSRSRERQDLYLQQALALSREPWLEVRDAAGLSDPPEGEDAPAIVILNDGGRPGPAEVERLERFVRDGGSVLAVIGAGSWGGGRPEDELLPVVEARPSDDMEGGGRSLSGIAWDHPVFQAFDGAGSGAFGAVSFYRHRMADPGWADRVLARFEDASPALMERRIEEGRVLVWLSTLDTFWNDLPLQPAYLPLVHQMVRHLTGWRPEAAWYGPGETVAARQGTFSVPEEAGLHRVETDEGTTHSAAVNVDRTESDLRRLDREAFTLSVRSSQAGAPATGEAAPGGGTDRGGEGALPLLTAAALLLLIETRSANGARGRRQANDALRGG